MQPEGESGGHSESEMRTRRRSEAERECEMKAEMDWIGTGGWMDGRREGGGSGAMRATLRNKGG